MSYIWINVDKFIVRVKFGLTKIDIIYTLRQQEDNYSLFANNWIVVKNNLESFIIFGTLVRKYYNTQLVKLLVQTNSTF